MHLEGCGPFGVDWPFVLGRPAPEWPRLSCVRGNATEERHGHGVSSAARVRKRRAALREAGLRPVQIWVPDMRRQGFAEECRRQSPLAAASDLRDEDLAAFLDTALNPSRGELAAVTENDGDASSKCAKSRSSF